MTFDELVAPFPPTVQETARRLLATARGLIPDATESGDGGDYGIGTGPGYKGLVFVISPHEKWVTLGIPPAADAPALRDLMRRAAG